MSAIHDVAKNISSCSSRIAKSGGSGLDLAIQPEQTDGCSLVVGQIVGMSWLPVAPVIPPTVVATKRLRNYSENGLPR